MYEKFTQVDLSNRGQYFLKITITKLWCISKISNKTASSLRIKKLNQTQNTFTEFKKTSMYIKYYIAWQISTKLNMKRLVLNPA